MLRAITYRPATTLDLPKLADLVEAFYNMEGVPFSRRESLRAMRSLLSRPAAGRIVLIEADLQTIGYYCLTFGYSLESHGDICLIDEIFVAPSFRRHGIGSKTVRAIASEMNASGHKALHLTVNAFNTAAIAFYKKNGFSSTKASLMTRTLSSTKPRRAKKLRN